MLSECFALLATNLTGTCCAPTSLQARRCPTTAEHGRMPARAADALPKVGLWRTRCCVEIVSAFCMHALLHAWLAPALRVRTVHKAPAGGRVLTTLVAVEGWYHGDRYSNPGGG